MMAWQEQIPEAVLRQIDDLVGREPSELGGAIHVVDWDMADDALAVALTIVDENGGTRLIFASHDHGRPWLLPFHPGGNRSQDFEAYAGGGVYHFHATLGGRPVCAVAPMAGDLVDQGKRLQALIRLQEHGYITFELGVEPGAIRKLWVTPPRWESWTADHPELLLGHCPFPLPTLGPKAPTDIRVDTSDGDCFYPSRVTIRYQDGKILWAGRSESPTESQFQAAFDKAFDDASSLLLRGEALQGLTHWHASDSRGGYVWMKITPKGRQPA